jgi:Spy/CpxP family protein refolding chaperone
MVLVFVSGLLIGGGVAYFVFNRQSQKVDPLDKFRKEAFQYIVKELKLTPEQQKKAAVFFDKAVERMKKFRIKHAPEMMMIIKENHEELEKILTPEQWKIYQEYRTSRLKKIQKKIP